MKKTKNFPRHVCNLGLMETSLYCAKNLPEVKAIVESFEGFDILVIQARVSLQIIGFSYSTSQNQRPI